MRKGTSGIKTGLILIALAIALVYGIYELTYTDLFEVSREYIVQLAGKASIVDFKKSCKIYDSDYLMSNEKELKGTPIYYNGKISDIKTSAFGDSEVLIHVTSKKYNIDENTDVVVKMKNSKYLRAYKGDKVSIYGKFNSIANNKEHKTIYIDGVRIEAE